MTAARILGLVMAVLVPPGVAGAAEVPLPRVVSVVIDSPHRIPEDIVRAVIGPLEGQPRRRDVIRNTLDRLTALDLFSAIEVEEEPVPGGVLLRYRLTRLPHVASVEFEGDVGLPRTELLIAAGLAPGDPAEAERLERARRTILERYRREGFLQAGVVIESRVDPATNAHDLIVHVRAGERARLGVIEVRGVDERTAARVRRALRLRTGDRYREDAVRDAVDAAERALRAENFPAARIDASPGAPTPEGVIDLVLEVVRGPRVDVEFQGNHAIRDRVLRERLTFGLIGVVDEAEVEAGARQIAAEYRERGHAFVRVDGTLRQENGVLRVRYDIREGPRVTVERVDFVGDVPLPEEQLAAVLDTRPPGLLTPTVFRQDALERDQEVLLSLLRAEGYADARVGPARVDFSEDRTTARVTIPIEAGPRVTVGALEVHGVQAVPPETLLAALPLARGRPWSQARTEDGRRAIEREYARRGFHGVEVGVRTERRDATVDVTYRVDEGTPTRVGRIVIRGLVRTQEDVVRRELLLASGDPLNPERLVEAQRRLTALGLFDRVDVEPLRPPPTPFADVVVTVQEGRPWHVGFGVGYSTFEGARGFVEVGHDNLFGTGRSLSLRLRLSERGDRSDLTYREPRLFGWEVPADAALFRERREEIGFQFERMGVTAGVRRDLAPWLAGLRGSLRYQLALVDRFRIDPALAAADVVPGTEIVASLTPELTLERRDRPLDPSRGSFHLLSVQGAGRPLGSDAEFVKGRFETHWFFDWLPPTVLALSARLGLATPYGRSTALPIEERFFAGGATTVRGYRERRLGPVDPAGNPTGGNGLLVLNAELRFPIWRWIGGSAFYDAGALAQEVEDLPDTRLDSGVGVGLRANTPVGPIRLDVGYPLGVVRGQARALRVYITIGHPF